VANNFRRSREPTMRDHQEEKMQPHWKWLREIPGAYAAVFCFVLLFCDESPFLFSGSESALSQNSANRGTKLQAAKTLGDFQNENRRGPFRVLHLRPS